ncbi:Putative N-acetyl-LL-diaminopimelate aminotransferase [Planctomycetes bacterium Pan216]|uniref:Aminotransferase n=1 Tax=Kolteria novifilia TaxID=2527975 RepID=A0A518B0V9_9BACT|nr:Putative N-acetyl-LL-diaminopimelate aminotransferase [Planctomycetes bacterium Pan216]
MPIWTPVAKAMIKLGVAQRLPSIRAVMGDGVDYLRYYSHGVLGSPNVELRTAQALLDRASSDVIDLSIAAPSPDSALLAGFQQQFSLDQGYPPVRGLESLREAIAEKLATRNRVAVDPSSEILVTNGVSQSIGLMLDSFVDRGSRVVLFDPTFFVYRLAAMNRGAWIRFVRTEQESGRLRVEEKGLRRALRGASVLFLNSPSNPTGSVLSLEDLERIAWWCRRYDVLIFSDEVYEDFVYGGQHHSIASLPEARDRTITASSFSKSHGLAGYRIGYLAGCRHLVQTLLLSLLANCPFVPTASQRLALLALREPLARRHARLEEFRHRRTWVCETLRGMGFELEEPGGAFFCWADVSRLATTGRAFSEALLDAEDVLLLPGDSCGPSGKRFVRFSFAGELSELREGLTRLARFLGKEGTLGSDGNDVADESPDVVPFRRAA